jgi:hypothetical protein
MQSDNQTLDRGAGKDVIAEIGSTCLLMRSRLISRVIAGIYDEQLRPFGIGAAQFVLLVEIYKMEPASLVSQLPVRLLTINCGQGEHKSRRRVSIGNPLTAEVSLDFIVPKGHSVKVVRPPPFVESGRV